MTTPIYDFVKAYSRSGNTRFHMPGHKGVGALGCEGYDITEISGADVLYSAKGVIAESEDNLSRLYGTAHSFYSTEGSTLAIKAMLAFVSERREGYRPLILAARNVHSAFVKAAALLDLDVKWLYSAEREHLCACKVSPSDVRRALSECDTLPRAVYVTSPDYLGNMLDIKGIADVCREVGVPLLVDNAHGAYLRFLDEDIHPITLGATMSADSAHKTLPVLTGGAYLHISKDSPELCDSARRTLSLFASTSPSYLTLASLDLCNRYLDEEYPDRLRETKARVDRTKLAIADMEYQVLPTEPLKIVLALGDSLAAHLRDLGIEVEFSDHDYTVLMITPENTDEDLARLENALSCYKGERKISINIPKSTPREAKMSIRDAIFAPCEDIPACESAGRISAAPTVSCPPAIPVVISGEQITKEDIDLFNYYNIDTVCVVKE